MDAETMKWFASLGVGGALAVMMFLIHRKDSLQHIETLKDMKEDADQRNERLESVVEKNTTAIAHNTDVSRAMVDAVNRIAPGVARETARHPWKGR
jgi:hypothetical protein